MTVATDLSDAYGAYANLLQVNAQLAALAAGTCAITAVTLSVSGGPPQLLQVAPPQGDAIYARLNTLLTARQTALRNQLTALGITSLP